MMLPKLIDSPCRLAELALENGWSPEEVASVLKLVVGSVEVIETKPLPSPEAAGGSKVLRGAFAKVAAVKR